jgi:hypothetical protein
VVAAGEKRRPRGRADRGRVERVVADPLIGEARQGGRRDFAAECVGQPESDVVQEHDEDVGRVLRQVVRIGPSDVPGVLQRRPRDACRGDRREGKYGARASFGGLGRGGACCGKSKEARTQDAMQCTP